MQILFAYTSFSFVSSSYAQLLTDVNTDVTLDNHLRQVSVLSVTSAGKSRHPLVLPLEIAGAYADSTRQILADALGIGPLHEWAVAVVLL